MTQPHQTIGLVLALLFCCGTHRAAAEAPATGISRQPPLFSASPDEKAFLAGDPASGGMPVPPRGFVSVEPAETWEQGLLSGNGAIGANVLSRPLDETIIFTHARMFLPTGDPAPPPDTAGHLSEMRQLIDRGLYDQATLLGFKLSGREDYRYSNPFVPAFDLRIATTATGAVRDYLRGVDFQTGVATVHWADDRGVFERRLFVSRADGVAVLLITGPGNGSINCTLRFAACRPDPKVRENMVKQSNAVFASHVGDVRATADAEHLTYTNKFTRSYPGGIQSLDGVARIVAPGGSITATGDTMTIRNADRVLALVRLEPVCEAGQSHLGTIKRELGGIAADYDRLLARHAAIHGAMFNRVRLDIGGGTDHRLPTEELLKQSTDEHLSRALTEKVFDAGRYNIISSTGELPPNLQGIWAGTYYPYWYSGFTQNGNLASAIAALPRGNTPELMRSYTNYLEFLMPHLRVNARQIFGTRGLILPVNTSTHGYNLLPLGLADSMWVSGAPWAAHFFHDYYLYTGDTKFLAEQALPFMEETALFYQDFLYEGPDGKYVFNPSTSPENTPANCKSRANLNATMDVAAAKELLGNLIDASRTLGLNQDKIPVWEKMLARMPDYLLNNQGMVKEWLTPKLEDQLEHRHSSQLYALLDGMPKEIEGNPQLREGFRKIIAYKLEHQYKQAGFMAFGISQLGQAATSLGDSELAYQALVRLVNNYWLNNLASTHNPGGAFNMDISGGLPAVVLKMLLESRSGEVILLPALPKEWPTGTLDGALCRGQIEVEKLEWRPGHIRVTLRSGKEQTITLTAPAKIRKITDIAGKIIIKDADHDHTRPLTLPENRSVTLELELEMKDEK